MAQLFGREWGKEDILRHIGRISQVCGINQYEFLDGKARGMRAAEVRTGSGLVFTVLLDRAMDIGAAEYAGCPLSWNSCTGLCHPSYFLPIQNHWLDTFGGGLITTCGLSNVGIANMDNGKEHPLHGVITGIPAENVKVDYSWHGNNLDISIEGTVREASVFGPDLTLQRLIWTRMGERKIFIEDRVTNEGYHPCPIMFLYHINIGWPILDKESVLIIPSRNTIPRDAAAEEDMDRFASFQAPQKNYEEKVFFHEMIPDSAGNIQMAVINSSLESPCFGIYIKYPYKELPRFTQWKMIGEGVYVLGIEPGNCEVRGRAWEREKGTLQYVESGKSRTFHLEIGVITTPEEVSQISDQLEDLMKK